MNSNAIAISFKANTAGLAAGLKQAEASIKSFSSKNKAAFDTVAKTAGSMADKMAGAIKTVGAAAIGGAYGLTTFAKSASELQSLRASFVSLTGSVDDANKVMNTLYQYGKMTAFDNASIQQSAKMFLANGVAINDLMGWMKNLGDVAGATGADLTSLALPLTQSISKGKLQTQDWYQILNQGAGGLQKYIIAALGAGHSQQTFSEDLEKGAVSVDVLKKALELASAEGGMAFEGAKKQSETYAGRLSNLQEQITNTGLAILGVNATTGEIDPSGVFAKMSKRVEETTKWLEDNKETIVRVANVVIDNLIPALTTLLAIWGSLKTIEFANNAMNQLKTLKKNIEAIKTISSPAWEGLKKLGGITFKGTIGAVRGLWSLLSGGFMAAVNAAKIGFAAFNAVLAANPIILIVIAIAAVVAALAWFFTQTELGKQIFQGFLDFVVSAWNNIVNAVSAAVDVVVQVISGIANFLAPIFDVIWRVISGLFIAAVAIIATALEAIYNLVVGLVSMIIGVITAVIQTIYGIISAIVGWIWGNILLPIINFYIAAWSAIISGVVGFIQTVMSVIGAIVGWINTNIIQPITGFFAGLWSGLVAGVSGFVQGAMSVIGAIVGWINNNIIRPISGFFAGLWNGVVAGIKGMTDGIRTAFNSIVGIIKAPINGIISLINGVIGGINKLKVPDWVPGLGGVSPNIPKIPMLARGGVVDSATLAMIGEAGKEVVMPLENNTGWISNLAEQINERGGSGSGEISVNIQAININTEGREFTEDDAVNIARQIATAVKSQGLRIDQMGALR